MIKERSAGAVIYRRDEHGIPWYLLLQAAPMKAWGFAKGKFNPGESERAAARREIHEEAGLDGVTFDPTFRHMVHYQFRRGNTTVKKTVVYFLTEVSTDAVQLSDEHVAFQWARLEEALHLVGFTSAKELLTRAAAWSEGVVAPPTDDTSAPTAQRPPRRRRPRPRRTPIIEPLNDQG
jgi:bis(5'-nucleosidyl)-tetraphosphatase